MSSDEEGIDNEDQQELEQEEEVDEEVGGDTLFSY
jgi:hypothetical protein